jgi:hypothetical protein
MKKWIYLSVVSAGVLCLAALVRGEEQKFTLPPAVLDFKPGPGQDLAMANCSLCHSSDYISIQPRLKRTVWRAEVTKMQQKYGAPIGSNNVDALVEYFTKNYGKEDPVPAPAAKP